VPPRAQPNSHYGNSAATMAWLWNVPLFTKYNCGCKEGSPAEQTWLPVRPGGWQTLTTLPTLTSICNQQAWQGS
jgi:hypothetical protein